MFSLFVFSLLGCPCPAWCATLSLESVLDQALEHGWEIRIAQKNIGMREYGLMEARSACYPTLSLRFDNEYVDFLGDGNNIISVGDQISANDASTFQHSLTLGLSYVLYDFGARGLRLANARREIERATFSRAEASLETRLNALDAYGGCLRLFRQRQITGEMVRLRKEVYRNLQALRQAGMVGQVRVNTAAVELAEGISLVDDLTDRMVKALENLGYVTGEHYPLEQTAFADLPPFLQTERLPDPASLPQVRSIDTQIARARAERAVALREMLPTVGLSAGYRMFGADQDDFGQSLSGLHARDATVGFVVRWEFFSGFRDMARLNQLRLQVEQLQLERGRVLAQLQNRIQAASRIWQLAAGAHDRHDDREKVLKRSGEAMERLAQQRVVDRVTFLEQRIELMEQERDMETTRLQRQLAGWQLRIWSEGAQP
jgi:outer membrane protein TolC